MSFELGLGTLPHNLYTKVIDEYVIVGDYKISYKDMNYLILYYLTNTNLTKNDPRIELFKNLTKIDTATGWGDEGVRFKIEGE